MQNIVPININSAARTVVLNHPNSFHLRMVRRVYNRLESQLMGLPTIGGLGVVSSDDEDDYDFIPLGNAWGLQVETFQPSQMMDRMDANNGSQDDFIFLIEPEDLLPNTGGFEVKKHDVFVMTVSAVVGLEVYLGFEVSEIQTTTNIPPFTKRYVCNRRSELDGG